MASISVVVGNCGGANSVTITLPVTVGTATGVIDTYSGFKNQVINGNVSTNDTGCSIGTTTYVKLTNPVSGTITSFNTSTGVFAYSPNNNFVGTDSYTYQINCNGIPQGSPITVNLTVIGATAVNDTLSLNANTSAPFNLTPNDTPCNAGATTTYAIATNTTNGTVTGFNAATGTGTYTPNTNFVGTDSLTYNILCNGTVVSTATETFTVNCVGVTTAVINGNANPVSGSTETYVVSNQNGTPLYTYTWTVVGGTILSGQGTTTVTVLWN